jgi:N4-bis(aminopropyl)spermidine synthase
MSGMPDLPEAVQALLADFGVDSRRVRAILCRLAGVPAGPAGDTGWTVTELVAATATSRRTVEAVLRALGEDLETAGGALRIAPAAADRYRAAVGCADLETRRPADPVGHLLPRYAHVLDTLRELVEAAPRSRRRLDHVAATPQTALRRALYLRARFWLDGAVLLCVGDHDLTSLAAALVEPGLRVTVVDVDERICEYIDREAARRGLAVRCRFADLRLGLPPSAAGTADLVFTDPPYTPEGVALFLARGLEGLRDRTSGRLLLAYGHGETLPALGAKVQAAVGELHLAYEAILPDFNAYSGAEAIGSVSDLYVCRPTARTWTGLAGRTARAEASGGRIYTQGAQAVEAADSPLTPAAAAEVIARHRPDLLVGRWPAGTGPGLPVAPLAPWLAAGAKPGRRPGGPAAAPAVALAGGFEAVLPRVLLAAGTDRVTVVVDNNAEAVGSAAGQGELADLLGPSYRLRFLRSTPAPDLAVVTAERAEPAGDAAAVLRWIQDRPHGRVANGWREGLIALARRRGGPALTKNDARALISQADPALAADDATLLELPRHRLRDLAAAVAGSVRRLPR